MGWSPWSGTWSARAWCRWPFTSPGPCRVWSTWSANSPSRSTTTGWRCHAAARSSLDQAANGPAPWLPGAGPLLAAWRSEPPGDQLGEVGEPVGVAPFVVVPAEHLGQRAVGLREAGVQHARVRVADHVAGDDRVAGGAQDAPQRPLGGGLERLVDLLDGGLVVQHDGQVGERGVLDRDAQRDAVQPPLELRDDQRGGPCR